ncbi:MAG: undecaprenyl diphosphate synthase family protein, partial [Candidatus Binataceae bacterium]
YFTETLWPDFREADLLQALAAYQARERRFGTVDAETENVGTIVRSPAAAITNGQPARALSTG